MIFFVLGAGYVGTSLLSKGIDWDFTFFASTTSENKIATLALHAKEVFLLKSSEKQRLKEILDRCDAMGVFVAPGSLKSYEQTYLETAKAVSFALKERKKPFYLLYTSSTFVYEGAKEAKEDISLTPQHPQAKVLLETEQVYLDCANDLVEVAILRLGGIYGPNRELLQRARRLSGKELAGSGDEPTNHIHLDDIVAAILFCTRHHLKGIYNLVNDDHPTRKELYQKLCKSLQLPPPIWNKEKPSERGSSSIVTNQKIREKGFCFKHPTID